MRRIVSIALIAGTFLGLSAVFAQQKLSPLGSQVRFIMNDGLKLSGELMAAQGDSTWLLQRNITRAISLFDVSKVQIRGRGPDSGTILLWTLLGGVATGGALTAACSSVAEGCGGVFVVTIGLWGLVGGAAAAITKSPHQWVPPRSDVLAPYARFPQGLPPIIRDGIQ